MKNKGYLNIAQGATQTCGSIIANVHMKMNIKPVSRKEMREISNSGERNFNVSIVLQAQKKIKLK